MNEIDVYLTNVYSNSHLEFTNVIVEICFFLMNEVLCL